MVKKVIQRFRLSANTTVLQFLKRIALVESDFGNDQDTFRLGFYGGIWQVNETKFDDNKDTVSHMELLPRKHEIIMQIFGIDWINGSYHVEGPAEAALLWYCCATLFEQLS